MYQGRNRLLQWTRAIFVLIVIALIGACGGSNSSGDSNSDGETTDGSNTDGGTSDGASTDGGNTNGGNTDGSTTGGGSTGGTTGGDLNITAYNNRIDMTPLQNVSVSVYGDDDRTITQTQQTNASGTASFSGLSTIDGRVSYTIFFEGEPGIDGSFITFFDSQPGNYVFFEDSNPECQPVATLNVTVNGATTGNFASLGPLVASGALAGSSVAIDNGSANFPNATICSDDVEGGNQVTLVPVESTGADVVAYTIINNVAVADATLNATFDMPATTLNWTAADPANAPDSVSLAGVRQGQFGSIFYSLLGLAQTTGMTSGGFSAVGAFPGDNLLTATRGMEEACTHIKNYPDFPATATTDIPAYQLTTFNFDGSNLTFDITRSDSINADMHQATTFFDRSTGFAGDEIQWNFFMSSGRTSFAIPDQPGAIATTFNADAIDTDRTTVIVSDLISGDGALNLDGFDAVNEAFGDGAQTNNISDVDRRACNFNLISFANVGDGPDTGGDGSDGGEFGNLAITGTAVGQLGTATFSPFGPGFQNSATIVWTADDSTQIFALTSGGSGASLVAFTPGSGALAGQSFDAQVTFGSNVSGFSLSENTATFSSVTLMDSNGATLVLNGSMPFTDTLQ